MQPIDPTPWYRQFWPWFIIAIPMAGVLASSIAASIALSNPPQIVTGDYATLGKALVDTHARADRAEALGLKSQLSFAGGEVRLQVEAGDPSALPANLLIRIEHPIDGGRDQQVLVRAARPGGYAGTLAGELPVRGRVILSDLEQTWWLSARLTADPAETIELRPVRL